MSNTTHSRSSARISTFFKSSLLMGVGVSTLAVASAATAQTAPIETTPIQTTPIDEVVATGTRQTIQDSIAVKRQSTSIVDALSSNDIGDIPALSIGEAIETLTGATSHVDQGGATEISIRGLGPFLGSTVFNGREATNGGGDRSVNFSQFPSELIDKLKIYKTQEASLIEGGVSGQIHLDTVKPLDYGKRRIQFGAKGSYNPDNFDLNNKDRGLGYRLTGSYIDQFELNGGGDIGISIGVQLNRSTNPEQEARTSSGFRDCRNVISGDANSDDFGVDSLGDPDQNCDSGDGDLVTEVDPVTGVAPDADTPFVLVSSQRSFRQNITDDSRDAIFGAVQFQPNDRLDINADIQYSDRVFTERRSNLVIDGNSFLNPGESGEIVPLNVSSSGALLGGTTLDGAEVSSEYQERLEEYFGGGLSVSYEATERLNLSLDASYSDTTRRENIIQTRLRSNTDDDSGSEDVFTGILVDLENHNQQFIFRNFDVTDPFSFNNSPRTREDLNQFRNNEIIALRGDADYDLDKGIFTTLKGGLRYSELSFDSVPRSRLETDGSPEAISATFEDDFPGCQNSVFPENDFLGSVTDGNLITNIDSNGDVIDSGTGSSYLSFDPICLAEAVLGRSIAIPEPAVTLSNVDVTEKTLAGYVQADYETTLGQFPVRGNFGVRVVDTDVTSIGLRGNLTSVTDPVTNTVTVTADLDPASFTSVEGGGSYTEFLPSFNAVVDLNDSVVFRAGIFRALSRPDPSDLGFGLTFSNFDEGDDESNSGDTVQEAVGNITASGNPFLEPLTSWNFDGALEWYPNKDTILAGGVYYKSFRGGFENATRVQELSVDGETLLLPVTTQETVSDTNTIYGFELTATHAFDYLPGLLSGFGAKLSYNWADSNFEFEDAVFGESTVFSAGEATERVGIVPPANLPGFSKHVLSAQLYYQIGDLDLQGIYKYRSEYFQQFITTPGNIRYIGNRNIFEVRASYKINNNFKVSIEALNIFNEERRSFNPTPDSFSEVNVYGPRIFAGIRAKF